MIVNKESATGVGRLQGHSQRRPARKGLAMTTKQVHSRSEFRTRTRRRSISRKPDRIGNAAVGAMIGGVAAGPVGAAAGAAIAANIEKGPSRRSRKTRNRIAKRQGRQDREAR